MSEGKVTLDLFDVVENDDGTARLLENGELIRTFENVETARMFGEYFVYTAAAMGLEARCTWRPIPPRGGNAAHSVLSPARQER